jgi:Flp pilus assembly protein TadD
MLETKYRVALLSAFVLLSACSKPANDNTPETTPEPLPAATYVGKEACVDCHTEESKAWLGSHHDLAMQQADAQTVLGDFEDALFEKDGVRSRFFVRDGDYWVKTDNAEGELQEFRIAYTFGVTPLQQYLIRFDDGRLQALPIAWDVIEGRWYHLYPDEEIPHTDMLHWTGREQNWNYMCAECHSTNLEKNYTLETDSFDTTWSEINVSCEACHGPASNHLTLAGQADWSRGSGLLLDLAANDGAVWQMNAATGIAERKPSLMSLPVEPEACGRCHSRRGIATPDYEFGKPLLDTHVVSLLEERLYFADGQIDEEVYVYGSFVQSKMYQAGVTCSDCHDAHSATLRSGGAVSDVCISCHLPAKFQVESHHRHSPDDVECVDCHMTSRDYMVIDGRRDHSFRIPRPDLTEAVGSPNACNQCHTDKSTEWASAAAADWFGEPDPGHFAFAIHDGRTGALGANDKLADAISDTSSSAIVRATALTLLRQPLSREQFELIRNGLNNADPLIRTAALRATAVLSPELHAELAAPLLDDPVRAVRLAAVDVVSQVRQSLNPSFLASFERAEREYVNSQLAIAERPEAIGNLANLFRERGDIERAESFYLHTLTSEPRLTTARANLADLYRALGRDDEAERVLREGLSLNGEDASLRHSLGLLLVRAERPDDALLELKKAAELEPDNSRFVFVYGVALNSLGQTDAAIEVLRDAQQRFPGDPDINALLQSLVAPQP